jgi:hypothetical protein
MLFFLVADVTTLFSFFSFFFLFFSPLFHKDGSGWGEAMKQWVADNQGAHAVIADTTPSSLHTMAIKAFAQSS